jgi:hypothetical protein
MNNFNMAAPALYSTGLCVTTRLMKLALEEVSGKDGT